MQIADKPRKGNFDITCSVLSIVLLVSIWNKPLNLLYHRSLNEEFNISNHIVKAPALLIMGEKDYTLKFPGIEDYIRSGHVKHLATNLEIVFLPEGSHFVQEQLSDQVNELILKFLKSHS